MTVYKVVSSNGRSLHKMYVNAESKTDAGAFALMNNYLLAKFKTWHISYIIAK